MNEQIQSLIRKGLTLLSGFLIAKGWGDAALWETISGAVVLLGSGVWSWWSARQKNTLKDAVEGIIPMDSPKVTAIVEVPAPTVTTKSGDTALMKKPNQ